MLSFTNLSRRAAFTLASIAALIAPVIAGQSASAQLANHPDFALKDYPPDKHISRRTVLPRDRAIANINSKGNGSLFVTHTGGPGGEPSIAINPNDTSFIAITSFAGNDNAGDAALFYSTDRGATWKEYFTIKENDPPTGGIPNDQDIDYDSGGALQGSFLTFNLQVASGGTTDPVSVTSWSWPIDANGRLAFSDFNGTQFGTDQPWMLINRDPIIPASDIFYSAYDDFNTGMEHVSTAEIPVPGTVGVTFTRDVTMSVFDGQYVNPGLRLGNDRGKGYMYSINQFAQGANNDGSINVNWILNRTTDGGQTWGLNQNPRGIVIANHNSNQPWPKFAGVNALLGGVHHVAVDPNTGDVYCVVGNRDSNGFNRLSCIRLTDDGTGNLVIGPETYVGVTGTTNSQFALPSVAVSDSGAVGVLYDEFSGNDAQTGYATFTAHVAISYDQGQSWDDTPIVTFLATEYDDGFYYSRQRILGDYQQMKAVGDTFFGTFSANQAAFGGPAVMGPAFFSIDAAPPGLKLTLDPPVVFAGQNSTGTLTLITPAPPGGMDVQMSSSNQALAAVPPLVHIDEGQTTQTFTIQTSDIGAPFNAPVISAVSGPLKAKATLRFVSVSVNVSPQLVFAGDTAQATITIGLPAPPGGVDVKLTSSNQALAAVPPIVHFNEGDTQQVVDVVTQDLGLPKTDVDIVATLGPNQGKFTMTVIPYVVAVEFLDQIFWTPAISVTGGQLVQGRVIIAEIAPTPNGVVINLVSQDPNVCQVTPSITVPPGSDRQYFYVFTNPVANDEPVEIRASTRGSSRAGVVTVLAPVPTSILLQPSTVEGGNSSAATVYLTGNAPNSGLDVTLSSDKPDAVVPQVVHVQPGKNFGAFVVTTTPVANKVIANIKATYNGVSASAPLTITGAGLASFTISPSQIAPGAPGAKATATLSSPAPNGATVALAYVNGNALVAPPTTITIAPNANFGTATLIGAVVVNSTQVNVTATYKASSKQATVVVLGNRVTAVTSNPQTLHVSTKSSCKVYLASPAPAGGAVVTLSATAGELPPSVRVLAGQTSASFSFKAPSSVPANGKAIITATYPAGVSVSTAVNIIL